MTRSVEETRIQLITQIDRLEELKAQIEFRGGGQIGELVKRGQETLSGVQVIADNAQRLANDLNGFGRTPTAETTTPAQATNAPAAAAKPADAINPMQERTCPRQQLSQRLGQTLDREQNVDKRSRLAPIRRRKLARAEGGG